MLPKRWRLLLRKEKNFFDQAKRHFSDGITTFYIQKNQELKLGVIVPKHQFLLSSTRHKISRRFYQAIEEVIKTNLYHGHYVFVLSRVILTKNNSELKQIILHHLNFFYPPT